MGGAKRPPSVKSVHIKIKLHISYNHENWHNYTLPCVKKIKKYINHLTHPLVSADMGIFSAEIGNFCYIKKYRYRLHFNTQFLILLTCFESVKFVMINMAPILMMSAKFATLDLTGKIF